MIRTQALAGQLHQQPAWAALYETDAQQRALITYLDRVLRETDGAMRDAQVPEPLRARVLAQVVENALPDSRNTAQERARALAATIDLPPLNPDLERLIRDGITSH